MSNNTPNLNDPLAFVRSMWSGMGITMPGMVTPTFDVDELDKRIKDMKAVEAWLRMNLSMLQMTIQDSKCSAPLGAVQAMGQLASNTAKAMNPEAAEVPAAVDRKECIFRCRAVALADDAADARPDATSRRSGRKDKQRGKPRRQAQRDP